MITDLKDKLVQSTRKCERIHKKIHTFIKGRPDLMSTVRSKTPHATVVDISRVYARGPLTNIQLGEIATLKEVIEKEFVLKFPVHLSPIGVDGYRVQMHIPLL